MYCKEKVLKIELNTSYKKFKECDHMSAADQPNMHPSLDTSPIWASIIAAAVRKL
jgi:hypothetical protein